MAHQLLSGSWRDDEKGLPRVRYFTPGSKEDKEARGAIAAILRSNRPLDSDLREWLASLFDVEDPIFHDRKIVFKRRYAGNPAKADRHSIIASEIWGYRRSGLSMNKAIAEVAEKFGLGERQTWKIWKKHEWIWSSTT